MNSFLSHVLVGTCQRLQWENDLPHQKSGGSI